MNRINAGVLISRSVFFLCLYRMMSRYVGNDLLENDYANHEPDLNRIFLFKRSVEMFIEERT